MKQRVLKLKTVEKLKPFHIDDRGEMIQLLPNQLKVKSLLLIRSKKNSIRANHYHKKDLHCVYLLEGKYEYLEKDMRKFKTRTSKRTIAPGDLVTTFPMHAHAMRFLENSVWIVITTEPRYQKNYEKDTIRLKLI